jgi:tetratricopeptide (TPR) repeat protein
VARCPTSSGGSPGPVAELARPTSAKGAIERGLEEFERGNVAEAVALFEAAMDLSPDADEARAALYNSACGYAKQKRWREATDAVARAINDYDLKLQVALEVRSSSSSPEWVGGGSKLRTGAGSGRVRPLLQLMP